MKPNPLVPIKDSIATQLLKVVFSIYFLLALTLTLIHMGAEYYNTKNGILQDLQRSGKIFTPGLTQAIWNVDEELLQSMLTGLMENPILIGMKISDSLEVEVGGIGVFLNQKGEYMTSDIPVNFDEGIHQSSYRVSPHEELRARGLFSYALPLTLINDMGEKETIGKATFYSSEVVVFQKVRYGFTFIIINSIIKTIGLWVIFLLASRIYLARPLSILTSSTEQLNLDNLEQIKIDLPTSGKNELRILQDAFNTMVQKLLLAKKRMASLRIFSQKIPDFLNSDPSTQALNPILAYAMNEMTHYLVFSNAVILFDLQEGHFIQHFQTNDTHPFLNKPRSVEQIDSLFTTDSPNLVVFNHSQPDSPIDHLYGNESDSLVKEAHFVYLKIDFPQPHRIVFYREANQPAFTQEDMEYLRSVISEIEIVHQDIQAILSNSRMEEEIQTAQNQLEHVHQEHQKIFKELEEATQHLIQAEKLSTLGAMVAGVAHEINNPVNYSQGASHSIAQELNDFDILLKDLVGDDPEAAEIKAEFAQRFEKMHSLLQNIKLGLGKITEMNHALRNYSRRDTQPSANTRLEQVIDESLVILTSKIKRHTIKKQFQDVPAVTCYPTHLGQVITNLIANASDALNEKIEELRNTGQSFQGEIQVSLEENPFQGRPGVSIRVEDNGTGVPPEIRDKIMEAFYTTKPSGIGTGLGLAICGKIMKEHEGTLVVKDSQNLKGACFEMWLPVEPSGAS